MYITGKYELSQKANEYRVQQEVFVSENGKEATGDVYKRQTHYTYTKFTRSTSTCLLGALNRNGAKDHHELRYTVLPLRNYSIFL